jgi:hypothetical protein
MGTVPKKLAYQWKRLKQTPRTLLRSVPPATARPFPRAPEAVPVIAATAKGKSWFNSHRGRVPRVAVQVRGEHWVRLNIVRFVPGEVGKTQRSSRHTARLDQELV